MKGKIISTLKFLVFLIIGIVLFWFAFKDQNLSSMKEDFLHANYYWLVLSVLLGILSHISRAIRWNMLIETTGSKPKTVTTFFAVMIGYLANLAFPRMGEVTRCGVIHKYAKIPLNKLIGTMLVERGVDFIALVLIFFTTVLFQMDFLGGFIRLNLLIPLKSKFSMLFSGNMIYVMVIIILVFIGFIIWMIFKKHEKNTFLFKLKSLLLGLGEGISSIVTLKNKYAFIGHTIFIWIMYFFMTYVCFFSIQATSHLGLMAGLTVMMMGSIGILAPVQGGIGAFHWIVSITLLLYNINQQDGLVMATLTHAAQMVAVVLVGFLSLILLPLFKHESTVHEKN